MKLLLVNDDGIEAQGLWTLAQELLSRGHQVVVVAPSDQRSGASHAVTLHGALSYSEVTDKPCPAYHLSGSPCDCVKFGLLMLCKDADCVISGINDTMNIGTDVLYSGTVNAAIEGSMCDVPSIAVSVIVVDDDYAYPACFIADNLNRLVALHRRDTAISINMPSSKREDLVGVKWTDCGLRRFDDFYYPVENGFSLGGTAQDIEVDDTCDVAVVKHGYISVCPVRASFTDWDVLGKAQKEDLCW